MECVTAKIKANGIPESWRDIVRMQALYSLEEKGYKKKLIWQPSTIDPKFTGAFSDEFIQEGELIRVLEKDRNLLIFNSKDDLPPITETSVKYLAEYIGNAGDLTEIFIPGISVNHFPEKANIWIKKISECTIHITARKDIRRGEELFYDYNDFGTPPQWLVDFAKEYDVPINYKGYCDFI